nr:hypothetical protein [Cohaesibacter sp. ES.047]
MWPLVVVKKDPVGDNAIGVLDGFEAVSVNALLLHRSDRTLHHSILLRAMRRDKLLFEPVAFDDCGEVPTGKNQTIVRAEKEFPIDTTKCSKSTDQSML